MKLRYSTEAELKHDIDLQYSIPQDLKDTLKSKVVVSENSGLFYFIGKNGSLYLDTYSAFEDKVGNLVSSLCSFLGLIKDGSDTKENTYRNRVKELVPNLKKVFSELELAVKDEKIKVLNIPNFPDLVHNLKKTLKNYLNLKNPGTCANICTHILCADRGSFDYAHNEKDARTLIDLL